MNKVSENAQKKLKYFFLSWVMTQFSKLQKQKQVNYQNDNEYRRSIRIHLQDRRY